LKRRVNKAGEIYVDFKNLDEKAKELILCLNFAIDFVVFSRIPVLQNINF